MPGPVSDTRNAPVPGVEINERFIQHRAGFVVFEIENNEGLDLIRHFQLEADLRSGQRAVSTGVRNRVAEIIGERGRFDFRKPGQAQPVSCVPRPASRLSLGV